MKKQFLKIAGVKTEDEFYNKYPSEEDFFKAHPEALKQLARGGEAFPQIATMDNFFTYGSPAPPTYYDHGGAFPMAQSEEQFFSPYYGNIPNPYNKAMGGSAMSFPYGDTGPSTHFMMQDGGYMPEEEPLPRMGVKGYLTDFIGAVKNTAAKKINDNLALHGAVKNPEQYDFEQARYGGNLKTYQSEDTQANTPDPNSDKGTSGSSVVNNYYYGSQGNGQQLPPEYQNDIDYLYGRSRPRSDFGIKGKGMFGNYRSTGWLKDEYGMDRLRQMGLTTMSETKGGLFKRPSKTYYFGQQGQGAMGFVPGQVDQQGMPVTPAAQTPGQQTPGATGTQGAGQQDPGKGMGFFARLFNKPGNMSPNPANIVKDYKDLNPDKNTIVDTNNPAGWNPYMSDWRNQHIQNRRRRTFDKLADLSAHETWQKDMLGKAYDAMDAKPSGVSKEQYSDIGLQGWRKRKQDRLNERVTNLDRKINAQRFQGKETSSEKKSRKEKIRTAPSSYQQYRKPMTLDEYNKQKEIPGQSTPVAQTAATPSQSISYAPSFDERYAKDIISSNEQNYFGTKSISEPFDPKNHSLNWNHYEINNFPGEPYKDPKYTDFKWNEMFGEDGEKTKQLNYFNDMPAPLKTVAADILYNQSTDPRAILLAAANVPGIDVVYSMEGEDGKRYRQDLRNNVDELWNKNKDMILQQYNDDPRAFTRSFSDYRDVYMQKTRSADRTSDDPKKAHLYDLYVRQKNDPHVIETDTWGDTGFPGTQYKAWHGRTDNTRQMVDDKYFGTDSGYVAPKFFARGGSYNAGDVVDMTPEEIQRFIAMGGQVEFLD